MGADRRLGTGWTVAELCRRWRVGQTKVLGFIRRGELIGLNVATTLSGRPIWRVTQESVDRFETRRSSAPQPRPPRRRTRRADVIDYYPG